MATKYGTIITNVGAAIIADCILNSKMLTINQAAAGDGGGAYYFPDVEQTKLRGEQWRGSIASAQINPDTPNMLDIKVVIPDEVGGFTIREMGLYNDDGVLVAVCNTPDTKKEVISNGASGKLTMLMHIVVADSSVVRIEINPSLDNIGMEDLLEAISKHNTDPDAHPQILAALSALDSRVAVLELKYGTDVTGNSFEVSFQNLDGVVVTGVWNEPYARIEF